MPCESGTELRGAAVAAVLEREIPALTTFGESMAGQVDRGYPQRPEGLRFWQSRQAVTKAAGQPARIRISDGLGLRIVEDFDV